jgi:hypothetical protein
MSIKYLLGWLIHKRSRSIRLINWINPAMSPALITEVRLCALFTKRIAQEQKVMKINQALNGSLVKEASDKDVPNDKK